MSEERPSSTEQDVVLVNEDRQNSEASVESGNRPFSSFLADALNAEDDNEPFMELPEVPMQHPLFDAPPVVPDSLQQFRPSNWRGLMAAIQNEPIDPIQLGNDIFEETRGSDAKYKCILNGLSGRPFRTDLQTLYNRRAELVSRLGSDNDIMVQLYDFNMGCLAKMDLDRRAFNNVVSVVNQNIFYKTINSETIPKQYKFNPNQMKELIFFTPIDLEEYKATNSADVLNHVVELNLTDQVEIVKQIALEVQNLCIKPEFLDQMSVSNATGKHTFMPEFFTFLKRILYQSFGIPYHKFVSLNLAELSSGLSNGEYPYERAAAVILIRTAIKTLEVACSNSSKDSDSDQSDSKRKQPAKRGRPSKKRRIVSEEADNTN